MERPRLAVIAPSVLDVIRFAGGWVFDRVMAGWDVTVFTTDHDDARPLRILGAHVAALESTMVAPLARLRPRAVAVEAGLYGSDPQVRQLVADAVADDSAEVRLWGDRWLAEGGGSGGSMHHQLSMAARAFKAQALAAAAAPFDSVEVAEVFRPGDVPPPRRTPDITPAA